MLNYQDTLNAIFALKAVKQSNKHQAVLKVCEKMGNPHLAFKVIHVTGTCGKGTVSAQAAWVLFESGFKVGMVISPHLVDFRERITVNFEKLPESYVIEKYQEIINHFQSESFEYSFEQVVCILGFCYLRDMEVDYGVIEVGCGGSRDSSNIVDPVISVITSVGLDHMHLLGNTIEEIAVEKAGVMKPGKFCVIGPDTPQALLCKIAEEKSCKVLIVAKENEYLNFIQENSKITEKIFDVVQVTPEALAKGLNKTQPFRFYKVEAFGKRFILDVGHNVMSIQRVIQDCKVIFGRNLRVVLCASKGKDFEKFVEVAFNCVEMVHFTSCEHFRMVSVDELLQVGQRIGFNPGISAPFKSLLPLLRDLTDDCTLIIGSCFMVEDVVRAFEDLGVFI